MPEKNQEITAVVQALGSQGEGVIKTEEVTFFVPRTLVGERVRFKVLKVKNGVGYGKVEEILSSSPERVQPPCPVFGKCGGCQLQHMSYAAQLSYKRDMVKNTLQKVGNIQLDVPMPVPSENQYAYRNKLQLPVGVDKEGNSCIGFYAERSHRIVPITACAIHPVWASALIAIFKEYMQENGVEGYDEEKGTGLIRHIVVRDMGGKFIVTVVCRQNQLKNSEKLIEKLKKIFPEFTLVLNVNAKETNVIFGEKFITLYGAGYFNACEGGIVFEAGPQTFVQVNENIRNKLYQRALTQIAATGNEVVVDCYSGAGLLTAMAAKQAKRAYGIEFSVEASFCADKLKEKNGLLNMYNICGKVEEQLTHVLEQEKGEKVSLILDPPRAGIHRSVLYAIMAAGIEKLVIISCNPATLARDLGILTGTLTQNEKGELVKSSGEGVYTVQSILPFDMFPQTKHVETLVCLSRK